MDGERQARTLAVGRILTDETTAGDEGAAERRITG